MKQLLLLAYLILFPDPNFAQSYDYQLSDPYKSVKAQSQNYFYKNGQIMAVKVKGERVIIQKWNSKSMKELSRNIFDGFPGGFIFEKVEELKGKYYLFYSSWDKKQNNEQLFAVAIDFDKGRLIGKGKRIVKNSGKLTNAMVASGINRISRSTGWYTKFDIKKSFDESRILIQSRKRPENKDDDANHDIIVFNSFDSDLNKLYGEDVKMPYVEAKMNNLDYAIDSEGNIYILTQVYKSESRRSADESGNINYRLEILKIDAISKEVQKIPIEIEELFLKSISLSCQKGDQIICSGYYRKDESEDNNYGFFMIKINDNPIILSYDIDDEFLSTYQFNISGKKIKKKKPKKDEFASLRLQKMVVNDDGSVVVFSEKYKLEWSYDDDRRKIFRNHYDDIIVMNIDKNGELKWLKKLCKAQISVETLTNLSFKHFYKNNTHYLYYTDNIANKNKPLDQEPEVFRTDQEGAFSVIKIDNDTGEVEKIFLFETGEFKDGRVPRFMTNNIIQSSDNEFFIETYKNDKKKEELFIKINMND